MSLVARAVRWFVCEACKRGDHDKCSNRACVCG